MDPNREKAARGGAAEEAKGGSNPAAEGSQQHTPDDTAHVPGAWRKELSKVREESAARRDRIAELEAEISRRDAEAETARTAKLEEEGNYRELNEQLSAKLATQKKAHAAELAKRDEARKARDAKLHERLKGSYLREQMASKGITDPEQQTFLMPSLLSAELTVDDDFNVVGDVGETLDKAIKAFNLGSPADPADDSSSKKKGAPKTAAPTIHPALAALGGTLPTRTPAQQKTFGSAAEETIAVAQEVLNGRG